jgi:hypothetical protein
MARWLVLCGLLPLVAWNVPAAAAPVDGRLNVQGTLQTEAGAPVTGVFGVTVRLYAAETGGTALWQSGVQQDVPVTDGLFDVVVGPLPAGLVAGNSQLWLETVVDTEVLPRRRIGAVATAIHAEHANTADLATAASSVTCTGCVGGGQTGFSWALGTAQGGAAVDVSCTCRAASCRAATCRSPTPARQARVAPRPGSPARAACRAPRWPRTSRSQAT